MTASDKISTGIPGLDQIVDLLRLGDNVVWKVDFLSDYKKIIGPFVSQSLKDNFKVIYVRFGIHEPLLDETQSIKVFEVRPEEGFDKFVAEVYRFVKKEGKKAFYVFDCLTDLLQYWYSDEMVNNFFKIICPLLYKLDTIAYFAIIRNVHTFNTIAGIRDTTQLLLSLFRIQDKMYIHPFKVWKRYSPTMFLPHLIQGQEVVSITASAEVAALFSNVYHKVQRMDYWDEVFMNAGQDLEKDIDKQEETKRRLMLMLIGTESRIFDLTDKYFSLKDILSIVSREIGTGFIGGKTVGMLLARNVLKREKKELIPAMEPHDSYFIGSNIFYTYLVQNGWWEFRLKQKTMQGYYKYAAKLKESILRGKFSENIQEKFISMLEYFGQSPIIVRSSSLLEDNFGNAFSGKYESVFCVNQGTTEQRYKAFEKALKTVYASTMSEDALAYRMNRGLFDADEQMAILVQRVSGDYHHDNFFPHIAGVGNSLNLYVWNPNIDMHAGMLRLVFGLGTRAVDRTTGDYVRIVGLDDPLRLPPVDFEDRASFTQRDIDVLSIKDNKHDHKSVDTIFTEEIKTQKDLFMVMDYHEAARMRELGYANAKPKYIIDFKKLFKSTDFANYMKSMMEVLSRIYDYPVDIEFTANFDEAGQFKVNLLQCRPLQTGGTGGAVKMPEIKKPEDCFFMTNGNFMGGNIRLTIDYVVFIDTKAYLELVEQDKYSIARQIGKINDVLKGCSVMLVGPGRWGTTTPSIGVPIHFSEICNIKVLCEVAAESLGFIPELSYGSHFFQDLVEMQIFYAALFADNKKNIFNPEYILKYPNMLEELCPNTKVFPQVIHVAKTTGLELFSDILSQKVLCL